MATPRSSKISRFLPAAVMSRGLRPSAPHTLAPKFMKQNDPVRFVQSLEVDPVVPRALEKPVVSETPPSNKAQGFVDAGSLTSFTDRLSGQDKADVLNSTLLAQLAANKKFNREEQTKEWYGYYKYVLENIGWIIQDFSFQEYQSSSATFTMDKVVLELLAAIVGAEEIAVIEATIQALQQLPSTDDAVVLFDTQSYKYKAGNFQIKPCTKDRRGQIVMALGTFYFSTSENVTRFLFWTFSSQQVQMYWGVQTVTLNEEIYSQVRKAVVKKLGNKAVTFVDNLDI